MKNRWFVVSRALKGNYSCIEYSEQYFADLYAFELAKVSNLQTWSIQATTKIKAIKIAKNDLKLLVEFPK
jgi:hypothetical protein